jgi:hypothetical protein
VSGRRHRRQRRNQTHHAALNLICRDYIGYDDAQRRVERCECPAFLNTERPAVAKVHAAGCPVLIGLKRVN